MAIVGIVIYVWIFVNEWRRDMKRGKVSADQLKRQMDFIELHMYVAALRN